MYMQGEITKLRCCLNEWWGW